jgi:hypothetical protein
MNPWMTDPGSEQEGGGEILPDVFKLLPLRPHLLSFFFLSFGFFVEWYS